MSEEQVLVHNPMIPYHPEDCSLYFTGYGFADPWEFTGWRKEQLSWKESAYLCAALSPSTVYRIKGPDALRFLQDNCTNNFKNFPVGKSRHGVICREDGILMVDGVILRTAEDDFITYWLAPYLSYLLEVVEKGKYDCVGEDLSSQEFFYQVAGPRSLEILEQACEEDLHDIPFLGHRLSHICGHEVRILRLGMAANLSYEVHGDVSYCAEVYDHLWECGKPYGMLKIGQRTFMMNHTENGFPQAYYHFPYPWSADKDFEEYLNFNASEITVGELLGSMGDDIEKRYVNPIELGWERTVDFGHDFPGHDALKKIAEGPHRHMVTLEWNVEDVVDVYASQFDKENEPYDDMDLPNDRDWKPTYNYLADRVEDADGNEIGISFGRMMSVYYREMISLACVAEDHSDLGDEVFVIWGQPGHRQKRIRAKVARFPYMTVGSNRTFDIESIPHYQGGAK
jgi:vanillate/3-O-methylgallate O-demethylase